MSRTGIGWDSHRLEDGRPLVLGGVDIPSAGRGLVGWSDADVLTHAVIDALLGAAGLGDIGQHFPDDDPRWRDANSIELLQTVRDMLPGPVALSSDAHTPDQLGHEYERAVEMLRGLGVEEIAVFDRRGRRMEALG